MIKTPIFAETPAMSAAPNLLWQPGPEIREQAMLTAYMRWLSVSRALHFEDYAELWEWSVREPSSFWESLAEYAGIRFHRPFTEVLADATMPGAQWFPGATLNYAEHVFRAAVPGQPALLFQSERQPLAAWSWEEIRQDVAALQGAFRAYGLKPGDRVAAFLPNIPEASIAFLATAASGLVWSACSPDFGAASVIERFAQIAPRVLIAVDGYQYAGKPFPKTDVLRELVAALPSLERIIFIPYLDADAVMAGDTRFTTWQEILTAYSGKEVVFEAVPFDHPIWILYSSGTTGKPKAITHGHGGVLLEHLKYLWFHNDVHPGERFFWFSTTGWMMWNFLQASWLAGATIVLYDGSPGWPDLGVLWRLAEAAGIHHFGTSAPYLLACRKEGLEPAKIADLKHLRSIGSTGSPLPPEGFRYVYAHIGAHIWLASMSGGTDVCSAFVGGNPLLPVYEGEIQCRALGCALYAYDDMGRALEDQLGEMVITRPMPSMPIYFWADPDGKSYQGSYFDQYPGIWRHGDFIRITPRGGVVIYGRSDATLNRHGIRIGTAEIYRAIDRIEGLADALILNVELPDGRHYMPLFVKTLEGHALDERMMERIRRSLREAYSPRHVPDEILQCPDIPYTISGKKLEAPVKKLMMGIPREKAVSMDALRNPDAMTFFFDFAEKFRKKEGL